MRTEREHRKWSPAHLAKLLSDNGVEQIYPTTVAKIEAGERKVRINEATVIADLFGVSLDSLLGRGAGLDNDLVYTLAPRSTPCASAGGRSPRSARSSATGSRIWGRWSSRELTS